MLPGQAEVAAVQGPALFPQQALLLPLMQQAGMSLLDPAPVPIHAVLALFLLKPLEEEKGFTTFSWAQESWGSSGKPGLFLWMGKLKLGEGERR